MAPALRSDHVLSRLIVVASSILLVVMIPLALIVLGPIMSILLSERPLNWELLGQVGESYGGLSAILSGTALMAISGSLLLQWRQVRTNIKHAIRQRHFELIKLAIEHPAVTAELYKYNYKEEIDEKIALFSNLQMTHWAMLADLEPENLDIIRPGATRLFRNQTARNWWKSARTSWLRDTSGRVRAMARTVDEEYERALADEENARMSDAPAPVIPESSAPEARKLRVPATLILGVCGAVAATAVARHLARRGRVSG